VSKRFRHLSFVMRLWHTQDYTLPCMPLAYSCVFSLAKRNSWVSEVPLVLPPAMLSHPTHLLLLLHHQVWSSSCSGELLGQHLGHTGPVTCMALDGHFLLSGSQDCTVCTWDVLPADVMAAAGRVLQSRRPTSPGATSESLARGDCQSSCGQPD
jgi:WD40 repeat protein